MTKTNDWIDIVVMSPHLRENTIGVLYYINVVLCAVCFVFGVQVSKVLRYL
jgi:hypothetical protein